MGFIKTLLTRNQVRKDAELLAEEKLYEYVGNEIESGEIRPGLWTKATSTATSSDEKDIKREYIRLRVEHLRAEGRFFEQFLEEASEAEQKEEPKPQPKPLLQVERPPEQQSPNMDWNLMWVITLACVLMIAFFIGASKG